MKKKIFRTVLVLLLILTALFLLWWFFFRLKLETQNLPNPSPCLVFQGVDSKLPCFDPTIDINIPSGGSATSASVIPKNTQNEPIYRCFSENAIEANGCISDVALEKKDFSLCSYVRGSYSQAQCKNRVENPKSQAINTGIVDTSLSVSPLGTFVEPKKELQSSLEGKVAEVMKKINGISSVLLVGSEEETAETFFARIEKKLPSELFAFSENQVRPESRLFAYGSGFTKTGNSLHVGNYVIGGLDSPDRMTLAFTLPSMPNGLYEGWVENSKGSSASLRKVRLVVTDNPAPRPTIESATPTIAKPGDEIVLLGKNIVSGSVVFTPFGSPANVFVGTDSIRFKLNDLPGLDEAFKVGDFKGLLFPLYVYIESEQGGLKEPFLVNVQF